MRRGSTVRFYRDLFDFHEAFRTPTDGTPVHVELRLGQLTTGLAMIEALCRMHGLAAGGGPPRALSAPHDFVGTLRAGWVADPDGNPIQIVARVIASA